MGIKATFFTMDALFAAMLLMTGLLALSIIPSGQKEIINEDTLTKDILTSLSAVNVSELNDTLVQKWINNKTIERSDNSILVQVGEFWSQDENNKANYLLELFFNNTFSGNESYSFSITIASETLFNKSSSEKNIASNLLTSRRMITGVEKGEAITGNTASAFLRKIRDKKTSSFAYFGGFVGQGNITAYINDIPLDVTPSEINKIILEADTPSAFDLYINDIYCDSLTPSTPELEPDYWDITHCNNSIVPSSNKFFINFDDLNNAYFSGGYIKVSYKTNEFQQNITYGQKTYEFPGINGIVNLFDSFYVPGELNTMTIYLHYLADHSTSNNTFYLTIGNSTIYADINTTTEQTITLSNTQLSSILNYTSFNVSTIPLRLGFDNLTYSVEYTGIADVILVTDISGSMGWRFDTDWVNGVIRQCDDSHLQDSDSERLSVAKCLDKGFVHEILNISGNKIGLVSYESTTNSIDSLDTNQTSLNYSINLYSAGGGTCICCGINSAKTELINNLKRTVIISSGSEWNYTNESLKSVPIVDSNNNSWYNLNYDLESSWYTGTAILGHDEGFGGLTITTEMGEGNSSGNSYAISFDEPIADQSTSVVEFTSGYTSTANTYGIFGSDDGWDWPGDFGYDNTHADYNGVISGALEFDWKTGSPARNRCSGYDCSGGYGITVRINQSLYDVINANGSATLKFDYGWVSNPTNPFESFDEIMIKANWNSPNSGTHNLGTEQTSSGGDTTSEIDYRGNPDTDFAGTYEDDITNWVESAGNYYLELGARLRASYYDEWGHVNFDNIIINVTNTSDHYYLRKTFYLTSSQLNDVRRGHINLMAEDVAIIYFNGKLLYQKTPYTVGNYWDVNAIPISGSLFREGKNVVAVELLKKGYNHEARFDLELVGINDSRTGAMMVMTDGEATSVTSCSQSGTPTEAAITAACEASQEYGIKIYSVGFGNSADEGTLEAIANCGNGNYLKSTNISALENFYQDTAIEFAEIGQESQTIIVNSGSPSQSILYPDSYISYNFTPDYANSTPNEISVTFQSDQLKNCSSNITIYNNMRVIDSVVTSYSGPHWTNYISLDNISVFNLSSFNEKFMFLGDPFTVQIPPSLLSVGNHQISVYNNDNSSINNITCAQNNSLIYTVLVKSATPRTEVLGLADGCNWTIDFEDGTNISQGIPGDYSGSNTCSYTNSSISYNALDAYDVSAYQILSQLDFDNDGRVFINIDTEDLEIIVTLVSKVPYLWGPAVIQAEVWS